MAIDTAPERLAEVRARIAAAETAAGRPAGSVRLIAVSKTFEAPEILPVIEAGQWVFGENRVQEAKAKWPALRADFADLDLHLIGPLQSNKAAEAVALFDAIHTIDRDKIAAAVAAEMAKQGRRLQLFVQVNTGAEPQKAGVLPEDVVGFVAPLSRGSSPRHRRPHVHSARRRGPGAALRAPRQTGTRP